MERKLIGPSQMTDDQLLKKLKEFRELAKTHGEFVDRPLRDLEAEAARRALRL